MRQEWVDFLKKVQNKISLLEDDGRDLVSFRGQSDSSWDLLPSLLVKANEKKLSKDSLERMEAILYYDFEKNASHLLKPGITSWEILFEMRHHGLPTRLLDWTENFATALYFALNGTGKTPTIWILDLFELNNVTYRSYTIPNPLKDLRFDYNNAYINKTKRPYKTPLAIIAPRTSARLFAQKGLFTLHGSSNAPINKDKATKETVYKFEIPVNCIEDARRFLKLAGINHYTIFQDLDNLSRHLIEINDLL